MVRLGCKLHCKFHLLPRASEPTSENGGPSNGNNKLLWKIIFHNFSHHPPLSTTILFKAKIYIGDFMVHIHSKSEPEWRQQKMRMDSRKRRRWWCPKGKQKQKNQAPDRGSIIQFATRRSKKMYPTNHHAPINRMSPKLTLSRVSWMNVMLHNINCSLSADLGLVLSLSHRREWIKSPVGSKLTELA